MNSRDRVLTSLNHEKPDKIPFDLGSSYVTGISKSAYVNLINYLKKDIHEIEFSDTLQQLVIPEEGLLKEMGVDIRGLFPNIVRKKPNIKESGKSKYFTDEWGVTWEMPPGSLYFNLIKSPLSGEIDMDDVDNFPWPNTGDIKLIEGLEEKAKKFYNDGYAIILESVCAGIFEMSCRIRGTQDFLMDLAINQDLACKIMDKFVELKIRFYEMSAQKLGNYIQFIREGDDIAGQENLMISINMYRKLIKPRHEKIINYQKEIFPKPFFIFFHSDGYIYDLLPDFIDVGIDILNPVQITGKSLNEIKKEFGNYISFWGGGCDTQKILPFGTADDVRKDVRYRIEQLSPNGGFIFCPIHNIQADVKPENIMAMYETYRSMAESVT
ncbi:MAG: uroporphyrinogen decarboxylase family protein [bacterium]